MTALIVCVSFAVLISLLVWSFSKNNKQQREIEALGAQVAELKNSALSKQQEFEIDKNSQLKENEQWKEHANEVEQRMIAAEVAVAELTSREGDHQIEIQILRSEIDALRAIVALQGDAKSVQELLETSLELIRTRRLHAT